METTLKHVYAPASHPVTTRKSVWKKFIDWTDNQEKNRFLWTAIAIAGHGCVFTIITVITILLTGNNFMFWPFAIGAMAVCLIVNLAALPTKITIPVLFLSLLVDLVIIVLCISSGFDIAATYR